MGLTLWIEVELRWVHAKLCGEGSHVELVDINKTLAGLPLHGYSLGNGRHESQSLYNFFIKMNQFAHANFATCLLN